MTGKSAEFGTARRWDAHARRLATILGSAALAATACAPAATATPAASPTVLSLDDVRSITGIVEFRALDEPDDRAAPVPIPDTPEQRRAVYDQPVVYGTDWSRFRSMTYSADTPHPLLPGFASLTQSIAVYPDARRRP